MGQKTKPFPVEAKRGNLLENLPETRIAEDVRQLAAAGGCKVERIVSPPSMGESAWYQQSGDEFVLLAQGSAGLLLDGEAEPIHLKSGDHILIPAGRRHRVAWTDGDVPTVWLAVHFPRS